MFDGSGPVTLYGDGNAVLPYCRPTWDRQEPGGDRSRGPDGLGALVPPWRFLEASMQSAGAADGVSHGQTRSALLPATRSPGRSPEELYGIDIQCLGELRNDFEADVLLRRFDLRQIRPAHLCLVRKLVLRQPTGVA